MAKDKTTSPKVAAKASKVLKKEAPKDVKSVAASALSQAKTKPKAKVKKK